MNELIKLEQLTPAEIFTEKTLDPFIEQVEKEVKDFKADVTTQKGRDEVRSFSVKVRDTKTTIEKAGIELVADKKKEVKAVDVERRRVVKIFNDLQKEARKPLTEWEEKEKKRIETHGKNLDDLRDIRTSVLNNTYPSKVLLKMIDDIKAYIIDDSWEEYQEQAEMVHEDVLHFVTKRYEAVMQSEQDQIELEKLRQEKAKRDAEEEQKRFEQELKERKEQEEKDRLAHEERIKEEAIKQAKFEAEEKEKQFRENERLEREKIEREKQDAIREKEQAIQREKDAKERAKLDQELAVKRERDRAEAEKKRVEEERLEREKIELEKLRQETRKREANYRHRKKINNEACEDLEKCEFSNEEAREIIKAIAGKKIRHINITY